MKVFLIASLLVLPVLGYSVGRVAFDQDTMGNYNLNYNTDESSRLEKRLEDGSVEGTYSYFDTDGMKHTIHYSAGAHEGFHAIGDSIPKSVPETHDLVATRAHHLAYHKELSYLHPTPVETVVYRSIPEPTYDPLHVAYLLDGKHAYPEHHEHEHHEQEHHEHDHHEHEHEYTFTPEFHTVKVIPYQKFVTHYTVPTVEHVPATSIHAEPYVIYDKEHLLAHAEHLEHLAGEYSHTV